MMARRTTLVNISSWSQEFILLSPSNNQASKMVLVVKNPPANGGDIRDTGLIPGWGKIPWKRAWQPPLVFLPGESHGQRILVGYSP